MNLLGLSAAQLTLELFTRCWWHRDDSRSESLLFSELKFTVLALDYWSSVSFCAGGDLALLDPSKPATNCRASFA